MDKNFFKKTRILDGGMGQELLNKGMKPKGTLWSAHALINKECHQMVIDTHLDFINAGAEVIVTTTFTARIVMHFSTSTKDQQHPENRPPRTGVITATGSS